MYSVNDLLRMAAEMKASDLHLTVGVPPKVRVFGELRDIDAADAAEALYALMESVALRVMLGTERDSARAKRRVRTMLRALAR